MSIFQPNFVVPPKQDFDTVGFQGSMQQVLQENVGNYVIVDFLTGSDTIVSKQGILYSVSSQFLVLYDDINLRYVVCDIFSVKFVTFLLPGYRPGQVPSSILEAQEAAIQQHNGTASATPKSEADADSPSEAGAAAAPLSVTADDTTQGLSAAAPYEPTLAEDVPQITPAQAAFRHVIRKRV